MYLLVLILPFLSFLLTITLGRYLSKKIILSLVSSLISSAVLCALIIYYEIIICKTICIISLNDWVTLSFFKISWNLLFDSITSFMLIIVLFISLLVHLYSIEYMKNDPFLIRFLSYLSLFTFFMLILITAGNYLQMFVGWEGVGLSPYLLINFWFTRLQANKSAMKAVIVNRIGDFGFYFGLIILFFLFKNLNFFNIFSLCSYIQTELFLNWEIKIVFLDWIDIKKTILIQFTWLDMVAFFLFLGAIGKSAQLGLHTWLPDAMEGPTPVSALIHAATMVTAGIVVLIRSSPLLEYSSNILLIISFLGALTAFFAGSIGSFQNDLKKVIAYSTCSQLGYMVFACGISNYSSSLFHLFNHAFFKALLFLGAGSIIHSVLDEQDMRKMGGLHKLLPLAYISLFIASFALIGLPAMSGFYSKDIIIEIGFSKYLIAHFFLFWLTIITIFFTSFYSIRLIYFTFFNNCNLNLNVSKKIHESGYFIRNVLIILTLISLSIGYLVKDLFIGLGTDIWQTSILILNDSFLVAEFINIKIKLIPLIFSFFGIISSLLFYIIINKRVIFYNNSWYILIFHFINQKWYFDLVYNNFLIKPILSFSYKITFKLIDRGIIEYFGPFGIINFIYKLTFLISRFQSGYIYHYIFVIILSLIFFLVIIYYIKIKIITFILFGIMFFLLFIK